MPHIPPLAAAPEEALQLIQQFQEKSKRISPEHHAWVEEFSASNDGRALLTALFGNSPYLSHLLLKEGVFFQHVMLTGYDSAFKQLLDEIQNLPLFQRIEELMHALRLAKQRAALLIALADITGKWELEQVTASLSEFAALTVNCAVNFLLRAAVRTNEIIVADPENPSKDSGLIVLAMGKLGSGALNYSSDIDLIIFFDNAKVNYSGRQTVQQFFVRLARDLVHIMQDRNGHGYVFRTDLRLRPDPGSTPLAVSISAAKAYYESLGQNWERAAMIKARAIAGDIVAGEQFLKNIIHPFVWRKHLDFAAIEDIRSIKRQIESKNGQTAADLAGYNIKIGHGGIREIEFFVQTQQLIWGGKERSLRVSSTCNALKALAEAGHITTEAAETLAAIYRYYRMLEHRLQMVADQQTHSLPLTEAGLSHISTFMGEDDRIAFLTNLREKLATVKAHYKALFPSSSSLGADGHNLVFTGMDSDPETVKALITMGFTDGEMIASRIRGWHHGRYQSTQSKRARELLTELVPKILKSLSKTAYPDVAFLKFDEFLSRLEDSIQLLSLFYANLDILNLVAELMGSYPYLAENLSRKPTLLDHVLSSDFLVPLPSALSLLDELGQQIVYARHYDDMLDIMRLWTHERQFQVGVQLIKGLITPSQARLYLSDIAEAVLNICFHKTHEDFAKQHGVIEGGKFAIVAMGKLGGRNLSFRSDIDLILIYDAPESDIRSNGSEPIDVMQYYNRLSRKFIHSFTALTSEGKLYDVDMRLRPSGNDGSLSTQFKSLDIYFDKTAQNWEYMALTRARVIMAEPEFAKNINDLIHKKLTKPHNKQVLADDIIHLQQRIAKQHSIANKWKVKYARGGIIDAEFIAQFLQLSYGNSYPTILDTDTIAVFRKCAIEGILPEDIAEHLQKAVLFLFDIQSILRLAYEGKLTDGVKEVLTSTLKQQCFEDIEQRLTVVEQQVSNYFNTIIQ